MTGEREIKKNEKLTGKEGGGGRGGNLFSLELRGVRRER